MVLHSNQGSVYASGNYNELPGTYGIIHSMSRAGTPTDTAAIESIKIGTVYGFPFAGRKYHRRNGRIYKIF